MLLDTGDSPEKLHVEMAPNSEALLEGQQPPRLVQKWLAQERVCGGRERDLHRLPHMPHLRAAE